MGSGLACDIPWPHLEFFDFLTDATEVVAGWPKDGWRWLRHSDVVRPDGTSLRRYQPVAERFPAVAAELFAREDELRIAFDVYGPLYPQALLIEDAPGYRIRRHTDCAGKVISAQVYLGNDAEGVILQTRDGVLTKQIPYRVHHGYAFKVTDQSWHRVAVSKVVRRSIQLIFYDTPTPRI